MQSENQHLRSEIDKLISNLIEEKIADNNVVTSTFNRLFYTKFLSQYTKPLLIFDSTNKIDICNGAAIFLYPSSTIHQDLSNMVNNFALSTKTECLIVHTGHNSIDQGLPGKKVANRIGAVSTNCLKKLKPNRLEIFKLSHVKQIYIREKLPTMKLKTLIVS